MRRKDELFEGALTESDESRDALLQELNVGRIRSDHSP